MSAGPVLVTGAGGLVGRGVVARLAESGTPVRPGLRRVSEGVAGVRCDLDDPASLAAAVAGASTIVHAAVGDTAEMMGQLAALLAAADAVGVTRLVFFSSVLVYGDRDGVVGETDEPVGALGPYGAAKRRCEDLVVKWVAAGPRRAVIFRPGIIYGRGSRFWIDKLADRIRAGRWGTFGRAGEGIANLIHVHDVAEATRAALQDLEQAGPALTVLNLTGPETPSWNHYFQALAHHLGAPKLREIGTAELALLQGLSLPAKALARVGVSLPGHLTLVPPRGEMRLFARPAVYSSDRAQAVLAWSPSIGMEHGLAMSLDSKVENEVPGGTARQVQQQATTVG